MPSFKPKSVKKIKINKKNSTTLDGKLPEFMNDFNKDELDKIPKLKEERSSLKKSLQKIENGESMENNPTIEQIMEMKDRLIDVTSEIKNLKGRKVEYFLDNSKYIFDYFENKKNISLKSETSTNKNKLLDSFFKINSKFWLY